MLLHESKKDQELRRFGSPSLICPKTCRTEEYVTLRQVFGRAPGVFCSRRCVQGSLCQCAEKL